MSVFLICEFDPLHRGHIYIMNRAKELYPDSPLVCVMSGNFVQRGAPASADKYARAKAAVLCGADLVLSIPFPFCSGSAEYFAAGALSVVSGFYGPGDVLIFGSECGDIGELEKVSERLCSEAFDKKLRDLIAARKTPYAKARQALYGELYGECVLLQSRNDILALEYIKAAKKLDLSLKFTPVKRDPRFLSASYIRQSDDPLPFLPDAMKAELTAASRTGAYPAKYENFEKALIYHLRTVSDTDTAEGGHGAIGRLKNAADKAENVKDLFEYASSSVYTDAKLRRALLFSVLRIRKEDLHKTPSYTQLLAANKRGLSVLAAERKDPKITVVTKPADHADVFGAERRADELYCMLTPKTLQKGEYMKRSPYIKEENE